MKKLLLVFCFLSIIKSYSQVNIGQSKSPFNTYMISLKKSEFDLVKKSTTYFIVPNELNYEEVKKNIQEIWTLNKIVFVSQDEYEKDEYNYVMAGNSIIRFINSGGAFGGKTNPNSNFGKVGTNFKLVMFHYLKVEKNKKGKIEKDLFRVAEIYFTLSIKSRINAFGATKLLWKKRNVDFEKEIEPYSYNFNLGYIRNYFQTLNEKLLKGENFKVRDGIKNKLKLKELKSQILYAPDWVLKQYNNMIRDLKEILTPEELFKKYEYKYNVISNNELNSKILSGEDFYYFMYTQFNDVKILSIIHSITGEIIYLTEDNSFNVKDSDLKDISKLID